MPRKRNDDTPDAAGAAPKKRRPRRRTSGATTAGESSAAGGAAGARPRRKKAAAKRKARRGWPIAVDGAWLRRWAFRAVKAAAWAIVLFLVVSNAWVIAYRSIDPPLTPLMWQRARAQTDGHFVIDKQWVPLAEIAPAAQLAVLAAEDQRFPDHGGFDTTELRRAIEAYREGAPLRGASTISQQVAKNAFLLPDRSFLRKGLEAYFTVLIEFYWGKPRILEVYLNIAEWGDGVYGIERAAQVYFNTTAAALTPTQAALLATALPSPLTRDPANPSETMLRRQRWILQQIRNLGGESYLERLR